MNQLPEIIDHAWKTRQEAVVLTTTDSNGMPNAIYATCVSRYSNKVFVIADNYFGKTRANINSGSRASLLFITKEGTSYQLKGSIRYHTVGEIYDDMKQWNPKKHPGHAAAAITIEEVYSGGEKLK